MMCAKSRVWFAAISLALIVSGLSIASDPVLAQPPKRGQQLIAPKVGEGAPDFSLNVLDGEKDEVVTLSDFAGDKEVVLIFGSYT